MGTMDLWWLPNMFSAYFRYFLSYKPLIQLKSFLNFKVQVIDFRCRKWKYNVLARVASEPNSEVRMAWQENSFDDTAFLCAIFGKQWSF